MTLLRLRGWLSGLWGGALLTIALVAAPTLFAVLERSQAGLAAGRIFRIEAYLSLALAIVMFLVERRLAAARAARGEGSALSMELMLILVALFCTVAGHFAVQPMMEAARAGQGNVSFGVLHTVSTLFFALKAVAVLTLAWRSAPR